MEIRIYDNTLGFQGVIENFKSLIWTRKYFETGEFQIVVPFTPYAVQLLQRGRLVSKRGSVEAGVIESIEVEDSNKSKQLTVKGRFLESYMDQRLIRPTYVAVNRKVEEVMHELITGAAAIPLLEMEELHGFTEEVTFQATYKNLLSYIAKLSSYSNIGFRFRPDFAAKKIVFETYKGLDRSKDQNDRSRVIFSEKYHNISTAHYVENDQLYKTVCYVGAGNDDERIYVVAGDDTLVGLDRREIYVNSSGINRNDFNSDAEYRQALVQFGNNKLVSSQVAQSFECDVDPNSNFIYRQNYDIGDIITMNKEDWGISVNLRITELREIYEKGGMTVAPVFGNPLPTKIDWEDK